MVQLMPEATMLHTTLYVCALQSLSLVCVARGKLLKPFKFTLYTIHSCTTTEQLGELLIQATEIQHSISHSHKY
jgi:hypothetical protein